MSPFIFLCVMNQPQSANHRLHKTAVWQILPVIVYLFFWLGKADILLSLQWDCNAHPDLHLRMQCTRVGRGICLFVHILSGRSPSAESFSRQRKCSRADGQEGSKSDSPRSKGPGPERHRPLPELPQDAWLPVHRMVWEPSFLLQRSLVASCCWDEKKILLHLDITCCFVTQTYI